MNSCTVVGHRSPTSASLRKLGRMNDISGHAILFRYFLTFQLITYALGINSTTEISILSCCTLIGRGNFYFCAGASFSTPGKITNVLYIFVFNMIVANKDCYALTIEIFCPRGCTGVEVVRRLNQRRNYHLSDVRNIYFQLHTSYSTPLSHVGSNRNSYADFAAQSNPTSCN